MKKRTKLLISGLAVLFVVMASMGTVAYFSKHFTSDKNIATAASFNVDVVNQDGQTIGDGEFDLGEKLYPGMDVREAYRFTVKKGKTDVPVEYTVNLNTSGGLFPSDQLTPIVLVIEKKTDGKWQEIDGNTFFLDEEEADFRILVSWPHGDHDIDFQGKTGHVKLDVVATQVDEDQTEEVRALLDEAEAALTALDQVNSDSSFNRGNFSKAEADAVQELFDRVKEKIDKLKQEKEAFQKELNDLQVALDEKVVARYVYYDINEAYTDETRLTLKLSADFGGQVIRYHQDKAMGVMGLYLDDEKFYSMRYATGGNAEVGDQFNYGIRFNRGTKTIDVTFTNLGDGNWSIESDWLIPNK